MNKLKTVLAVFAAAIVLSGCGMGNNGIIKAGSTVITQKEFDKAFKEVSETMLRGMHISADKHPDNVMVLMAKEHVVSQLVINAILNDAIKKSGITVSKEDIDAAENDLISKFESKDQFLQILRLQGITENEFRKNLEQEVRMKKYTDSIAMVSIGEDAAKKYYKENPDKFKYPKQVRASHILVSANENVIKAKLKKDNKEMTQEQIAAETEKKMAEAKAKIETLRKQALDKNTDFAKLAKDNSDDNMSAVNGGDLGFFSESDMAPEFSKAAFSLKPNTISGIVKTQYGWHIIKVTDRKEAGRYSFEESKNDIIQFLENQEKMRILRNKIAELSKNTRVEYLNNEYNPEVLRAKVKEAAKDNPELSRMLNQNAEEAKKN